jgi:hypothetical protein
MAISRKNTAKASTNTLWKEALPVIPWLVAIFLDIENDACLSLLLCVYIHVLYDIIALLCMCVCVSDVYNISCMMPMTGRYVQLQKFKIKVALTFCEVAVWGK